MLGVGSFTASTVTVVCVVTSIPCPGYSYSVLAVEVEEVGGSKRGRLGCQLFQVKSG